MSLLEAIKIAKIIIIKLDDAWKLCPICIVKKVSEPYCAYCVDAQQKSEALSLLVTEIEKEL